MRDKAIWVAAGSAFEEEETATAKTLSWKYYQCLGGAGASRKPKW